MRTHPLLNALLLLLLNVGLQQTHAAAPALTITHVPVFRRELMQSQLDQAYEGVPRQWGAPVRQLVLNSYCDAWRALHARTYAVQSTPMHWLPAARQLGYTVLLGLKQNGAGALLLTRAKTDEQLQSLLSQHHIATPDRLAAVTAIGKQHLIRQFRLGDDKIKLTDMAYDDMPMLALVKGDYQAALTSPIVYQRMQSKLKQDIRVINISSSLPRAIFVVDPAQLAAADIHRLRNLLLGLNSKWEIHNYRYITPDELSKLDHDLPAIDSSHCPLAQ